MKRLISEYFLNDDVLFVARDLLGKSLFTNIGGEVSGGIIVETEAYRGIDDRASHAFGGRKTRRNAMMFAEGGVAYVYLCYGMHCLLNFVTNAEGIPDAVLIRSILPTHGSELMLKRTGKHRVNADLCNGPGKLSKALGVDMTMNGAPLNSDKIWLEDRDLLVSPSDFATAPRVGVDYAGEDALRPYRYTLLDSFLTQKFNL